MNSKPTPPKKDQLYATHQPNLGNFCFDEQVVDVFDDMIARSVPGYQTMIDMTGMLAGRYAQPDTQCYDLGCSLGASTLSIRHQIKQTPYQIIGIDNSPEMVATCQSRIANDECLVATDILCADIRDINLENASVIALNFTLQFIPTEDRTSIMAAIFGALKPGGILILSEKIRFQEADQQQVITQLHHDFKRANGYSDLEISQKRNALENVLLPETLDQHITRMHSAGFAHSNPWFQCLNFVSILAQK